MSKKLAILPTVFCLRGAKNMTMTQGLKYLLQRHYGQNLTILTFSRDTSVYQQD